MAFIPVPGVARVELRMQVSSTLLENVWHFQKLGYTQIDLNSLVDGVAAWWFSNYRTIQSASVILTHVYARGLTAEEDLEATSGVNVNTPGAIDATVDPILPYHVTLCASLRTGFTGRSARGRTYSIGATESQVVGSLFNQAYATSWVNGLQQLSVDLQGAGWSLGVVSYQQDNVQRTTGRFLDVVDVAVVDRIVDSQRRRLPGRGK